MLAQTDRMMPLTLLEIVFSTLTPNERRKVDRNLVKKFIDGCYETDTSRPEIILLALRFAKMSLVEENCPNCRTKMEIVAPLPTAEEFIPIKMCDSCGFISIGDRSSRPPNDASRGGFGFSR
jgi:hypothetical protein